VLQIAAQADVNLLRHGLGGVLRRRFL